MQNLGIKIRRRMQNLLYILILIYLDQLIIMMIS